MEKIPYREGEKPPAGYVLASDEDGTRFWIRLEDLTQSPVQHSHVPDDVQKIIRWQWRHLSALSPAKCSTFEQWELGFLRDTNPMQGIAHWIRLTYALLEMTHRHPSLKHAEVYESLIHLGVGRGDLVRPKRIRAELEALYATPDERLADPDNFTAEGRFIDGGHLE